jgi:plasmid stabilization system protein ParE
LNTVVFDEEAAFEVEEAFFRYELISAGLGGRFKSDLDRTLSYIADRPKMYQIVRGDLRRALLKSFPYGIFYRETAEVVFVVAVFGQPQDSALWSTR